jgi:hypothetical protein
MKRDQVPRRWFRPPRVVVESVADSIVAQTAGRRSHDDSTFSPRRPRRSCACGGLITAKILDREHADEWTLR